MSNSRIGLSYLASDITDYEGFPTMEVSATLNADTSWPELVDAFVQFLRGVGFYIDAEWAAAYIGHKELSEKAKEFLKEFEARRLVDSEVEVEYNVDLGGRDSSPQPRRTRSKKKAKK
jgi:hypothetical protein